MTILAIASSPRAGGNSERLLDEACKGAISIGARLEKARLCEYKIEGCRECGGCNETGECVVDDDYQYFYRKFLSVDRIILASPVFFMGLSAQAKAVIDRCQSFWIRKYKLHKRIPPRGGITRKGYIVSSGGSGLDGTFDCPRKESHFFYLTLDMATSGDVCVNGLEAKGDIEKHPDELRKAFELGLQAAETL